MKVYELIETALDIAEFEIYNRDFEFGKTYTERQITEYVINTGKNLKDYSPIFEREVMNWYFENDILCIEADITGNDVLTCQND